MSDQTRPSQQPEDQGAGPGREFNHPEPALTPLSDLLAHAGSSSDPVAFAELYNRTFGAVHRTVLAVVRDHAQAAEVSQEVYLQVWQTASRYQPSTSGVLSWLLTIAHRRAVDRVRHSQASRLRDHQASWVADPATPAGSGVEEDIRLDMQQVQEALEHLPDSQRQAVFLAHFAGYSHSEIADLMGVPLGTVKTRIRDGLRRLRLSLGEGLESKE